MSRRLRQSDETTRGIVGMPGVVTVNEGELELTKPDEPMWLSILKVITPIGIVMALAFFALR